MTEQIPECVVSSPISIEVTLIESTTSDSWVSVQTGVPTCDWKGRGVVLQESLFVEQRASSSDRQGNGEMQNVCRI